MSREFRLETRPTIQERLRNLLTNEGIWIEGELWQQAGFWRRTSLDLARWGGFGWYKGKRRQFCCWDTMTHCVRTGIVISEADLDLEIMAAHDLP
jgi:hypothetical protein